MMMRPGYMGVRMTASGSAVRSGVLVRRSGGESPSAAFTFSGPALGAGPVPGTWWE